MAISMQSMTRMMIPLSVCLFVLGATSLAGCEDAAPPVEPIEEVQGGTTDAPIEDAGREPSSGDDAAALDASLDASLDAALDAGDPALRDYDGPLSLEEAGLYKPGTQELADDVAAYVPRFALWSDGAKKKRYLRLPPGATIDTSDMDNWVFPVGSRAFKEFTAVDPDSGAEVRVETRLLEKRENGWLLISFAWNESQTEAVPVPRGQKNVLGTTHDVPSQEDCRGCHTVPGDQYLGLSAIQLSRASGMAPPAPLAELTLASMRSSGQLTTDPGTDAFELPGDATAQAALGVLHADCGSCHRAGTFAFERTDLALNLLTSELGSVAETAAYRTAVGVNNQKRFDEWPLRIASGDSGQSSMVGRMSSREDLVAMPPLGTKVPDTEGAAAVGAWIDSL